MKKKILIVLSVVVVCIGAYLVKYYFFTPQEIHMHAGFHLYVDGALQDFSAPKYMSLQPCSGDPHKKKTALEIQNEKAHLHDFVGDIMHAHVEGGTWGDLFKNINYDIDDGKEVKGYIDGNEVENIFAEPIKPYQSAVILIGTHDNPEVYLEQRVTKERILDLEQTSQDCGVE